MVWYGMVNVDLYSAIVTKVSCALISVSVRGRARPEAVDN